MTCIDLGKIAYAEALDIQTKAFNDLLIRKQAGEEISPDMNRLYFCEHQAVLTIGKSGKASNLLAGKEKLAALGIELYHVSRGGDITYHGPGQITAYPVFDLECWNIGLRAYIERLEDIVIRFLSLYGLKGELLEGAAGVWIEPQSSRPRKICAIGVRSSRYVCMHGLALNINTDLRGFSLINPCGFTDKGATSLAQELGAAQDFDLAKSRLKQLFLEAFR
jgi:lipoyl(octanoyl) transferase